MKNLAVIILNWNGENDTVECLKSLEKDSFYDIFLLDNGSKTESIEIIKNYLVSSKYTYCESENSVRLRNDVNLYFVLSSDNKGFAKGNNFIVEQIKNDYDYVLLLNNDTEVPVNTIETMLVTLRENGLTAVTCDIRYYADKNSLWNAGGVFTWYGDRRYFKQSLIDRKEAKGIKFILAEFITGCALLIDCNYIRKYGLFTEDFFHGEEDYNFCINLKRRGQKVGVDLSVRLYHKVGQSLKPDANKVRNYNATTVHYCNRIIDYKKMMNPFGWKLWRGFYLCLVFVQRARSNMSLTTAFKLVQRVLKITTDNDCVRKELYDSIMHNENI